MPSVPLGDCPIDRAQNAHLRSTPAQMALIEPGDDLVPIRRRIAREHSRDRHDDSVDAIAALRRLLGQKDGLQVLRRWVVRKPLDGLDAVTSRRPKWRGAGLQREPVEQHGAGTAIAFATADPGSLQPEIVTKRHQQGAVFRRADCDLTVVDREGDDTVVGLCRLAHVRPSGRGRRRDFGRSALRC